jgi:hypothetical protein
MKQTAVEWLFKQISTSKYFYKLMEDINSRSTIAQSNIFVQAKEMEKENVFLFAKEYDEYLFRGCGLPRLTAEQYYNQTYKQD